MKGTKPIWWLMTLCSMIHAPLRDVLWYVGSLLITKYWMDYSFEIKDSIGGFHVMSQRPCWCTPTKEF